MGTEPVSLRKTLRSVCKKLHSSFASDVKAKRAVLEADEVRPGDVFFALPGSDEHLEESVGVAIHRGCAAVVADRPIQGADSVPYFILPNVMEGYAAFCHAIHDDPAKSLKVIGITGTSGKTSTSYLISGMLAEAGFQVGLIGSLGVFDGYSFHSEQGSELSPDRLACWLARMAENGCTHAIIEASSRSISQGALGGIRFDAICITNIRRDHLDFHKSVEQYRRSKLEIFKYAKKNALAICNIDDRISEAIVPLIDLPLLSIGMRNQAEIGCLPVERTASEQTFIVTAGTEAVPYCTKIIGDEHIYNCMMATALGIAFEIDIKTIAHGIQRVESVPGRMERLVCGQDFNVYVDTARTSDSLAATLRTAREITEGRLICVFGAAGYHEPAKRPLLAKALQTLTDSVILTAATHRNDPSATQAMCDIGKSFTSQEEILVMPQRTEAIAWALSQAGQGDTVLIIGKGEAEHPDDMPEQILFSDRHFARQWLCENQTCSMD